MARSTPNRALRRIENQKSKIENESHAFPPPVRRDVSPTTGDQVRLADTDLFVQVERDLIARAAVTATRSNSGRR